MSHCVSAANQARCVLSRKKWPYLGRAEEISLTSVIGTTALLWPFKEVHPRLHREPVRVIYRHTVMFIILFVLRVHVPLNRALLSCSVKSCMWPSSSLRESACIVNTWQHVTRGLNVEEPLKAGFTFKVFFMPAHRHAVMSQVKPLKTGTVLIVSLWILWGETM